MRVIADLKTINKHAIKEKQTIILKDKYFFVDIEKLLNRYESSFFLCDDIKKALLLKEFLVRDGVSPARVISFLDYKRYKKDEEIISNFHGMERLERLYCFFHTLIKEYDFNNLVIADCERIFNSIVESMTDEDFWEQ